MLQLVCHLRHAPLMLCFMAVSSEIWSRAYSEEFLFFTSWCNLISHTHRLPSFFSSLTLLQRSSRTCSAEPGSSTFHTPLSLHRVSMDSSQLVPVYVGTLLKGHFSNRTSTQQRPVELSVCEMIAELPVVGRSSPSRALAWESSGQPSFFLPSLSSLLAHFFFFSLLPTEFHFADFHPGANGTESQTSTVTAVSHTMNFLLLLRCWAFYVFRMVGFTNQDRSSRVGHLPRYMLKF